MVTFEILFVLHENLSWKNARICLAVKTWLKTWPDAPDSGFTIPQQCPIRGHLYSSPKSRTFTCPEDMSRTCPRHVQLSFLSPYPYTTSHQQPRVGTFWYLYWWWWPLHLIALLLMLLPQLNLNCGGQEFHSNCCLYLWRSMGKWHFVHMAHGNIKIMMLCDSDRDRVHHGISYRYRSYQCALNYFVSKQVKEGYLALPNNFGEK